MDSISSYVEAQKDNFLSDLKQFLAIPSISADSNYEKEVIRTAEWLATSLKTIGMDNIQLHETPGYPIVTASKIISSDLPTVLIYGHYDVQPPDPIDLWHSPPFEPIVKDGKIYARGASDDKGQVHMHLKALEYMLGDQGELPCNVKVLIEGEEEVGSSHLEIFLEEQKDLLSTDVVLISDTSIVAEDIPSITAGLRGITYVEVELTGPNRDLHSGVYGGAIDNPVNVLCEMIAKLKDDQGKITIPGFYDEVVELSIQEREDLGKRPFDKEEYMSALNIKATRGESGYSDTERATIRPSLDVNGIWGGYIGLGAKTVLPSKASAKISMRLVPNQNSEKIGQLFTDYFLSIAPDTVSVKVNLLHGGEPAVVSTASPAYRAAAQAMRDTFGKEPIPTREGGSIPIVVLFQQILNADPVLMGFGLDSDAIHSPNEHFHISNYLKGIETIPRFYHYFKEFHGGMS